MVWCPRRRCSGERGVHQTGIKPRMVQTICLALMGPRGRLLCQLWDHPAWLRTAAGFRFARPLYCADELPGSVGVWPDRLAEYFGLTPAFRAPPAGCVWVA